MFQSPNPSDVRLNGSRGELNDWMQATMRLGRRNGMQVLRDRLFTTQAFGR